MTRSWLGVRAALIAGVLLGHALSPGVATGQETEVAEVKRANGAYYAALSSRNIQAMEQVWARTPRDVNIAPPVRPTAHVGWDTIRRNYEQFWGTLDELTVSMENPTVEIRDSVAWVYGIENAKRRDKNGQASEGPNFGTSIFVKEDGRWVMVFHQAVLMSKPR